jgi:hypothetical protein
MHALNRYASWRIKPTEEHSQRQYETLQSSRCHTKQRKVSSPSGEGRSLEFPAIHDLKRIIFYLFIKTRFEKEFGESIQKVKLQTLQVELDNESPRPNHPSITPQPPLHIP